MLVNYSFSDKNTLVVCNKPDLARLIIHTLRQIGLVNVAKADDVEHAYLQLTKSNVDLVILLDVTAEESISILQRIRHHNLPAIATVPTICVAETWSGEHIVQLRDAGVTVLATLPLTMRTLLKHTTRALNPREFITSPSYRGPCRRSKAHLNYGGPLRRHDDPTDKGSSIQPRNPAPPPAAAEAPRMEAAAVDRPAAVRTPPPVSPSDIRHDTPELRQTRLVVDNAHDTAMEVDELSSRLRGAASPRQRGSLCHDIAMVSERMINLMSLADVRVQEFGCSDSIVDRLESIRSTIIRNAEGLAEAGARRVIDYGSRILSGRGGVPLGVSVALAHQIGRIDAIVDVVGGLDKLADASRQAILQAREVTASVAALETKSTLTIPEFSSPQRVRKQPHYADQ